MKRGCFLAGGIGALLAIPLTLYVASRWTDIPPVDDSDLVLPARKVDPAQNPFPAIRSFALSSDARERIQRAWSMIRGEEEMDESFLRNLVAIEAQTLERFESYSRMTDWQQDQELSIDTEIPPISDWLAISRLRAVEIREAIRNNQIDEAIESGMSILRFGEGLHHAEGGFIHQIAGGAIAGLGISEILRIVETGQLSSDQLSRLDAALSGLLFSPEIFAQAFIVEYRTYVKVIGDLAEGKVNIGQIQNSEENPSIPGNPPARFFFKRNKTTKLMADAFREFIAESKLIRSEARDEPLVDARAIRENAGALYFSGNLIGRVLYSIVVPAAPKMTNAHVAMRVSLDLLRLRIAMERFRLSNGTWPDNLEILVPELIEKIPVDPMDGQPIRYLRERKVIYSVGVDFVDDGGIAPDKKGSLKSRKEIVIELRSDSVAPKQPDQ